MAQRKNKNRPAILKVIGVLIIIVGLIIALVGATSLDENFWPALRALMLGLVIVAAGLLLGFLKWPRKKVKRAPVVPYSQRLNPELYESLQELRTNTKIRTIPTDNEAKSAKQSSYEYTDVKVFRPDDISSAIPPLGESITFDFAPENPYDSEAIKAVYDFGDGPETVGYMYRGRLRDMMRDWLKRGDQYDAEVTDDDERLVVTISFYRT